MTAGMMQMNLDGFLRNSQMDFRDIRSKIEEILRGAAQEGVIEDEDYETLMAQLDGIHGDVEFLVSTMKLPANDPDANKLEGIRMGLEAAAKACKGELLEDPQDETDTAYDLATGDCIEAIRALDPAAIMKGDGQ